VGKGKKEGNEKGGRERRIRKEKKKVGKKGEEKRKRKGKKETGSGLA